MNDTAGFRQNFRIMTTTVRGNKTTDRYREKFALRDRNRCPRDTKPITPEAALAMSWLQADQLAATA